MKIPFYILGGLFVIISLYFVGLSVASRKQPELGVLNGQLRACPRTPNCVSSEFQIDKAFVEPLVVTTTAENAWKKARHAVIESGGEIVTERNGYLHAQFVTLFMRYVDDVELRLDNGKRVIHIRSASRVGKSDMGANRARVEKIRQAFVDYPDSDK